MLKLDYFKAQERLYKILLMIKNNLLIKLDQKIIYKDSINVYLIVLECIKHKGWNYNRFSNKKL